VKRVLFVSYYYPPIGGVGGQRVVRFAKYLPEQGWEATVLAAEPNEFFSSSDSIPVEPPEERVVRSAVLEPNRLANAILSSRKEPSIQNELPITEKGTLNVRALREEFRELPLSLRAKLRAWLFIPDDRIGWIPEATRDGLGILHKASFDCIVSTSAPYTAHLVALRLARRTGLPWIADFRDPWSSNTFLFFPTELHQKAQAWLERIVVERCDCVLTCSEGFREDFWQRYPSLQRDKFAVITNGFDPADFPEPVPEPYPCFTIAYVGDFYGPQTPIFFLLGLRQLIDRRPEAARSVQVLFVGSFESRVRPLVEALGLSETVQFLGFLSHERAIDVLRRSHALLLVLGTKRGGERIYPAKAFEYLAACKPILGLAPEGLMRDLLKEAGVAFLVNPTSEEAISKAIERLFLAYQAGELPDFIEPANLSRFNGRSLAKELAMVLEKTLTNKQLEQSLKGKKR